MSTPKVLFLGANGRDTTRLRLGAEVRDLRRELATVRVGEAFDLVTELAVRPTDLQSLLLSHAPHVLHFSGHGSERREVIGARGVRARGTSREFMPAEQDGLAEPGGGLLLEDARGSAVHLRPDMLLAMLSILKRDMPLRCVVLNACFTAEQAESIAKHVDCVVGTAREIDDDAAVAFTTAFYRAIAHGKSVGDAFSLGRVEIGLRGLPGEDVPRLFCHPGIAPENVFVVTKEPPKPTRKRLAREAAEAKPVMRAAQMVASRPEPYHVELHLTRMKGETVRPGLFDARLLDGESKGLDAVGVMDLGVPKESAAFLQAFVGGNGALTEEALQFGQRLLDRLLGDIDVRSLWKEIQQRRAGGQRALRLELVLPAADAESVASIPFELLADQTGFLFRRPGASFVRSVRGMAVRTLHLGQGDAIFTAWANPRIESEGLDAAIFAAHEQTAVAAAHSLGLVVRQSCPNATRAMLENRLSGQTTAIVSLVARGHTRGLWLHEKNHSEYPNDTGEIISARDLAAIFRMGHVGVALLWTPQAFGSHPISAGMATTLLDPEMGDLTAVVTSHVPLRSADASAMLERMLSALGNAQDLGNAVGEGRRALPESNLQWAAPVYYARPRAGMTVSFVEQVAQAVEMVRKASPAERGKAKSTTSAKTEPKRSVVRRKKAPEEQAEDIGDGVLHDPEHAGVARRFPIALSSRSLGPDIALSGVSEDRRGSPGRRMNRDHISRGASSLAEAVDVALEMLYEEKIILVTGASGAGKTAFALEMQKVLDSSSAARMEGPKALYVSLDGVTADDWFRRWEGHIRQGLDALAPKRDKETSSGLIVTETEPYTLLILDHADALSSYRIYAIFDAHPELSIVLLMRSKPRYDSLPELRLGRLSPDAARALFLDTAGNRLTPQERDSAKLTETLLFLAGHPLSLVVAAKLVGAMPLALLQERLGKKSALDVSFDWLAEHHAEAHEMFLWLGYLPLGLPFALLEPVFGESAQISRSTLLRNGLASEWGPERRLALSPSLRERALERECHLAPIHLRNRAVVIFRELTKWLVAFPFNIEDWGKKEQIAITETNLKGVCERLVKLPPVVDDESTERALVTEMAANFDNLSRILGPSHDSRLIADRLILWMEPIVARQISLWRVLAALYKRNNRIGDEQRLSARALLAAGDHDAAADVLLAQDVASAQSDLCWEIMNGRASLPRKQATTTRLVAVGRAYMRNNRWEDAGDLFLKLAQHENGRVDLIALARESIEGAATDIPKNAARRYYMAFRFYEASGDLELAATALKSSADASMKRSKFADAEARYLALAALWSQLNDKAGAAAAENAASEARTRQKL